MAVTARSVDDGTGINVLVDPGATGDMQVVKIALGTTTSETLLPGDATRGLSVDPRRQSINTQLTSAGLTTAATTYTIGDALGTIFEVTNACRASGGSGILTGLSILDEGAQLAAVDCYLWKASISQTDNSPFNPSDSDARNLLHIIRFPSLVANGPTPVNRFMSLDGLSVPYYCSATSLYLTLVTLSANGVFAAVGDIKLNVFGYTY